MKYIDRILLLTCFCIYAHQLVVGQSNHSAYTVFDSTGKSLIYEELIRDLSNYDVVFLGEMHNCPITHWLEFRIVRSLHEVHKDKLVIGEEMMESDNQVILNEYMQGKISENRFEEEMRLWSNYATDYKMITAYAKAKGIPLIATNIPRRYANAVSYGGLQVLNTFSSEAKAYMAPLPIDFEYDEEKVCATFGAMMQMAGNKINIQYLVQAQAVKDATMAWFIAKNMKEKFVHLNGSAHSDYHDGIIPYLLKYRPQTSCVTVVFVRQENIEKLEEAQKRKADFYICIPNDMVVSY